MCLSAVLGDCGITRYHTWIYPALPSPRWWCAVVGVWCIYVLFIVSHRVILDGIVWYDMVLCDMAYGRVLPRAKSSGVVPPGEASGQSPPGMHGV